MNWKLTPWKATHCTLPVLVEAARYGDHIAYEELISRTYQPIKAYCSAMGSVHDADDLAQETVFRAIKNPTWFEASSLEGYMIHIAKCVCADFVKAQQRTRQLHDSIAQHHTYTMEDPSSHDVLLQLNDEQREAFVLTQLLGFSYEECSEISAVPIGTVRSRVARARDSLRAYTLNIVAEK